MPNTLEEKLDLLTYKNAIHSSTWIDFEFAIKSYDTVQPHRDIDPDGNGVLVWHPLPVNSIKDITRPGKDDIAVNIYIDPENNLDWVLLNGWHKYSFQTIKWFENSFELKNDSSVYKINLAGIIDGYENFLPEFIKLAAFIDRTVTQDIEIALHTLYKEWEKTILQGPEFERRRNIAAEVFRKIANDFERNNQQYRRS